MSHPSLRLSLLLLICAAVAVPANAQDDPRFALVASFPNPTVSVQWEVTDRFALRVEGSYSYRDETTSESGFSSSTSITFNDTGQTISSHTTVDSTTHTGSIGVAGIFTLHRTDDVRLYAAPRVALGFSRQSGSINTTITGLPSGAPSNVIFGSMAGSETFDESFTTPSAGAAFGAAVNVHSRLALFGEAGFVFATSEGPLASVVLGIPSLDDTDTKRSTFNTRAVAGVMFRF